MISEITVLHEFDESDHRISVHSLSFNKSVTRILHQKPEQEFLSIAMKACFYELSLLCAYNRDDWRIQTKKAKLAFYQVMNKKRIESNAPLSPGERGNETS